jgi:Protein of unknown function (DUF3551)
MLALTTVVTLLASLFLFGNVARADGTWCAQYGNGNGGTNCGFYSFAQCEAARSGNGGFCFRNAASSQGSVRQPRARYRRDESAFR